jgi:hypothetical protein
MKRRLTILRASLQAHRISLESLPGSLTTEWCVKPNSLECHGLGLYDGNTRVDPVVNVRHHDLLINII